MVPLCFFGAEVMIGHVCEEQLPRLCFRNLGVARIDAQQLFDGALQLVNPVFEKGARAVALPRDVVRHELGVGIAGAAPSVRRQQDGDGRRMDFAETDNVNGAGRFQEPVDGARGDG